MRKILGIIMLVSSVLVLSSMKEVNRDLYLASEYSAKDSVNKVALYDFKKAGKQIELISKLLIADTAYFEFGAQSYKKYAIIGTTSFYNQPAEILHYILLAEGGRSFHFEIPFTLLYSVTLVAGTEKTLELTYKDGQAGYLKEYNSTGGIVYSLGFTALKFPIPLSTNDRELMKNFIVLKKKVEKYKSKYP